MMAPIVTVALYTTLVVAAAWLIVIERPAINLPRLGLTALSVITFFAGPTVYGLEYEDAYVHAASAAWRTFHWLGSTNGFYSTVCTAGAVSDCIVEGSFGTHLIGFSILIAIVRALSGGTPIAPHALSAMATLLTVQLVWTMLGQYVRHQPVRLIGIALLLTAPSYLLISSSGFAEPLFSFFLTLCLYLYLRLERSRLPLCGWILFAASGALMILAKKEGALLLLLIAAFAVWAKRWGAAMMSLTLLVIAVFIVGILSAAERHSIDIGGQPVFQLAYLPRLFPTFSVAAINPRYFGLLGLFVTPALLLVAQSRDRLGVQFAIIVVAYTFLYCAHARHRFFVAGEPVEPVEMVRYIAVIAPIASLLTAQVLDRWWRARWSSIIPAGFASAGLVLAIAGLYAQRIDMAEDEKSRIAVLSATPDAAVYVTPYSAALFANASETALVVDVESALIPDVFAWLAQQARLRTAILLDPALCASSAPPQWLGTCARLRSLGQK